MLFLVLALPKLIWELFAFCMELKKKNSRPPIRMMGSSVDRMLAHGLGNCTSYGTFG